jgi:hypothetical protein
LKRQKYTTSQGEQKVANIASRTVGRNIDDEEVISFTAGGGQRPFSHTVRDLNVCCLGRRVKSNVNQHSDIAHLRREFDGNFGRVYIFASSFDYTLAGFDQRESTLAVDLGQREATKANNEQSKRQRPFTH